MSEYIEKIPVLVYTDDGRDVDDIEAMTYLAGSPNIEIVGVVATHMIPDRRALIAREVMKNLGCPDVPIGVGSVYPIGHEDDMLVRYLRKHTIKGRTYEGEGLIECFPDGGDLILETIAQYGKKLKIAALAPLTDLAKAAQAEPEIFATTGGILIQGQAHVLEDDRLQPDAAAYNLSEDMRAAETVFEFQDRMPFTLLGKHAAYKLPLLKDDFDQLEATGNPVGKYLKTHAIQGLACFAERDPEIFERVLGVPPEMLSEIDEISRPYDALVAKLIANPAGLVARRVGKHALIGMTPQENGVPDPASVKAELMGTMLTALRANAPKPASV